MDAQVVERRRAVDEDVKTAPECRLAFEPTELDWLRERARQ